MQHIITDEEATRFRTAYINGPANMFEAYKAALSDFLSRRPESSIAQLRPIAEMPEKVPEGCLRVFGQISKKGRPYLNCIPEVGGCLAADIQFPTPDPEAEMRREFESWWASLPDRGGKHKSECYEAYKAGKFAKLPAL